MDVGRTAAKQSNVKAGGKQWEQDEQQATLLNLIQEADITSRLEHERRSAASVPDSLRSLDSADTLQF